MDITSILLIGISMFALYQQHESSELKIINKTITIENAQLHRHVKQQQNVVSSLQESVNNNIDSYSKLGQKLRGFNKEYMLYTTNLSNKREHLFKELETDFDRINIDIDNSINDLFSKITKATGNSK